MTRLSSPQSGFSLSDTILDLRLHSHPYQSLASDPPAHRRDTIRAQRTLFAMFNAPRRMGGNLTSSAFLSSPASSPTFDPLASTVPNPSSSYGEVDPWSSSPNFARSGNVRRESEEVIPPAVGNGAESALGRGGLSALLGTILHNHPRY
jgi:hypothetical protein